MKNVIPYIFTFLLIYGCRNKQLPPDFLGNYQGIQPSYFMKNQYGDDMIINGQKILVPSTEYKFHFEENGVAKLQQTRLEDNRKVYYEGKYIVISKLTDKYNLKYTVSDNSGSSPSYLIIINMDKTAICHPQEEFGEGQITLKKLN